MINGYLNQLEVIDKIFNKNSIIKRKLSSIYFGGGTPSLMSPLLVQKIIDKALIIFDVSKNLETTLEANPSKREFNNVLGFKKAGINRISLGIQSLNNEYLTFLGRLHNVNDIDKIMETITPHFNNISADFLYGYPDQKIIDWENEISSFTNKYDIKHLSTYQLSIEKETPLYNYYKKNKIKHLSSKKFEDFYKITKNTLENKNFIQYEISNFSQKNYQSKHNKLYWNSDSWYGIGPGAVGRLWNANERRLEFLNFRNPSVWLNKVLYYGDSFKHVKIN